MRTDALLHARTHAGTAAAKGSAASEGVGSRERPLSDRERDRFEDMLRTLTVGACARAGGAGCTRHAAHPHGGGLCTCCGSAGFKRRAWRTLATWLRWPGRASWQAFVLYGLTLCAHKLACDWGQAVLPPHDSATSPPSLAAFGESSLWSSSTQNLTPTQCACARQTRAGIKGTSQKSYKTMLTQLYMRTHVRRSNARTSKTPWCLRWTARMRVPRLWRHWWMRSRCLRRPSRLRSQGACARIQAARDAAWLRLRVPGPTHTAGYQQRCQVAL